MPDRARNMVQGLNIASWEYGSACKYARVLCIPKFWIWQDSQHTSALNISELWNTTDADPETSAELSGNKTYLKFFFGWQNANLRLLLINLKWFSLFGYACKYAKVLYTLGFWIYQVSEYGRVLNMPGFWICQGFEYTGLTQATEPAWMSKHGSWLDLIMSENARIFNTNLILISVVSLRSKFDILEKSAKSNMHCFCKMLYWRCLTGLGIWFTARI